MTRKAHALYVVGLATVVAGAVWSTIDVLGWLVAASWVGAAWAWHRCAIEQRALSKRQPRVDVYLPPELEGRFDERELANRLADVMRNGPHEQR